jgi:hypothetical protein
MSVYCPALLAVQVRRGGAVTLLRGVCVLSCIASGQQQRTAEGLY